MTTKKSAPFKRPVMGPKPAGIAEGSREHKLFALVADLGIPRALLSDAVKIAPAALTKILSGAEVTPLDSYAKVDFLFEAVTLAQAGDVPLFPTRDYSTIKTQLLLCYTLHKQRAQIEELTAAASA